MLLALSQVGIVFSYFTDQKWQENRVSIGENDTKIEEEFDDPKIKEINPKKVEIYNRCSVPCFARVKLLWSDFGVKEEAKIDFDMENWEYGEQDDYYYYKKVLEPGTKSTPFFSTIRIKNPKVQEDFSVTVYEETYQQGRFSKEQYKEAFSEYEKNRGNHNER